MPDSERPVEISDDALCRRVADGDEAAFDLLVSRYQGRAYRLAWSVLRDAEEARDLSQEAFIKLHQNAGKFEGRSSFSTWFYRLLVNTCLDHRRRHRWWRRLVQDRFGDEAEEPVVERQPAPFVDPAEGLAREQAMKRLWEAVGGLSPQQRAAVTLYAQEGLPTVEIALALGCSEATVRVHLHRALAALRKTLGRD